MSELQLLEYNPDSKALVTAAENERVLFGPTRGC